MNLNQEKPETMADNKPEQSTETLEIKELAVHERRNWVRTTYSCNNRCIFCLDGDVPQKGHIEEEEVFKKIREGFRENSRLVISGGDASIHPSFIKFVQYGKELGYNWIQTISNGRMFAYKEFTKQAADAGLNEVTFSMHGHNSELHDTLTGIKGGFAQSLRGMINVLKDGRVVVNVDCVINGLNYKYLDEILQFYMRMGIHEFDLLQIVPFGRAWWEGNREKLFYNVEEAFPYLNKAFRHAYKPGNYIWTNRFPVAFLEGVEELIQDPHKLFDEVNGRYPEYQQFVEHGQKLDCYPDRCNYCFIKDFCATLYELKDNLDTQNFEHLEISLLNKETLPDNKVLENLFSNKTTKSILLEAENFESAFNFYGEHNLSELEIHLKLENWEDFYHQNDTKAVQSFKTKLTKLVISDKEDIEKLLPTDYELEIIITRNNSELLLSLKDQLESRGKIIFNYPGVETLTESREHTVNPKEFFANFNKSKIPAKGVPKCIYKNTATDPLTLRLSSIGNNGIISMNDYTRDYICNSYLSKSNRCKDCVEKENCRGLHINAIRVYGFKLLTPIK